MGLRPQARHRDPEHELSQGLEAIMKKNHEADVKEVGTVNHQNNPCQQAGEAGP